MIDHGVMSQNKGHHDSLHPKVLLLVVVLLFFATFSLQQIVLCDHCMHTNAHNQPI